MRIKGRVESITLKPGSVVLTLAVPESVRVLDIHWDITLRVKELKGYVQVGEISFAENELTPNKENGQ